MTRDRSRAARLRVEVDVVPTAMTFQVTPLLDEFANKRPPLHSAMGSIIGF